MYIKKVEINDNGDLERNHRTGEQAVRVYGFNNWRDGQRVNLNNALIQSFINGGGEVQVVKYVTPVVDTDTVISNLWTDYDNYITNVLLDNSIDRNVMDKWAKDYRRGVISHGSDRDNKIIEVEDWIEAVWAEYNIDKASIVAGNDPMRAYPDYPADASYKDIQALSAV